ncbi:hypothetical protein [Catellatospora chokoriensis]|uniref:Uncharacterized protein n=1 Tax=Catellatospora chokoriensis TaxID=310353 RepID=A0A8J3NVK9_9ACTN|nr:hypothetical protein [Catellatospora chokoriensis]GIF94016.1 hypothetical protein Cch02nite_74600 [Catellatospora chokoriensis]
MRIRTSVLVPLLVAVLGGVLVPASPALAEPVGGEVRMEAPMVRIGVDHKIAEANGYVVRVDSNGVEYSVKKGAITPFNEVWGECGSSFVYLTAVDTKKHYTSIYTGFTLAAGRAGAVWVDWNVSMIDNYGASVKTWDQPEASVHDWRKTKPFTSSGPGWAYAKVLNTSIVTLWDGTICWSYGPQAEAYL